MTHAVMNAILEVGDDLVLPAIVKSIENRAYRLKAARHIQDEAFHEKYMDELGPFAKELLAASAHEREQMIDAKDLELYARQLERMERLDWEELDEAHKQYLEELELADHYVRYWREDSDITQITQVEELRRLEIRLGVHKRTRDLEPMEQVERLDPGQLDYLDDLRKDVDQSRERLKELEKNPWNLDKVEQAAEIPSIRIQRQANDPAADVHAGGQRADDAGFHGFRHQDPSRMQGTAP